MGETKVEFSEYEMGESGGCGLVTLFFERSHSKKYQLNNLIMLSSSLGDPMRTHAGWLVTMAHQIGKTFVPPANFNFFCFINNVKVSLTFLSLVLCSNDWTTLLARLQYHVVN